MRCSAPRSTPRLRKAWREETILIAVLLLVMVTGIAAATFGSKLASATAAALVVGLGASGGKLAFDSIVQRDAPDANRGRSFAKFETRFQLAWVVGAFIPVIIPIPIQAGLLAISLAGGAAGASYYASLRYLRANGRAPEPLLKRVGVTGAAKAAWEAHVESDRAGGRSGARAATAGGRDPVSDARADTAPVAVTPPVVPLGGKPQRMTLPPPGQAELPLEPPAR